MFQLHVCMFVHVLMVCRFVRVVAFSSDGRFVVSGADDKTARVWDTAEGVCVRVLRGHALYVHAFACLLTCLLACLLACMHACCNIRSVSCWWCVCVRAYAPYRST